MPTTSQNKVDPIIKHLIANIESYAKRFNKSKFIKAFNFARDAHGQQVRKSGDEYIIHPVEAANILTQFKVDETTLIAALLHDVPEDTDKTVEDIERNFGSEVGFLVEGITKLSKVYYRNNMADRQVESLKKLLLHSAKDPRVVLIKLADRLHNMRTLIHLPQAKRERIAKETLEIYVPIANLLGIQGIKTELEDLCFKYLFSKDFEALKARISSSQKRQKRVLDKMLKLVKSELKKEGIEAEVEGRQKTLYSIYKKIKAQGKGVEDVDDRIALRVICKSRDDCYAILGMIHSFFKPKPARFKDYIAVPKNNGYRSIHTTVFGIDGVVSEIQIRTKEMHIEAQYGIAAHYMYKSDSKPEQYTSWAQKILNMQKEQMEDPAFMENLKIDVFQDRIFVFTPTGDVIDLPRGATGIDFAYAIHSNVGNSAVRIEINGRSFPLSTIIPNGSTVRVITTSKERGPERQWLSFARTQQAKQQIKHALKHENREKKLQQGYTMLGNDLERIRLESVEDLNFNKVQAALQKSLNRTFKDMDELLICIGEGEISSMEVIQSLYPDFNLKNLDDKWNWRLLFHKDKSKEEEPANVWLKVVSLDKVGQGRKILNTIAQKGVNVLKTIGSVASKRRLFVVKLLVEINSMQTLSNLCTELESIDGVIKVERFSMKYKILTYSFLTFTLLFWAVHPLIIASIVNHKFESGILTETFKYLGLILLFIAIYVLNKISQRAFPGSINLKRIWAGGFFTFILATSTLISEAYFIGFKINWLIVILILTSLFIYYLVAFKRQFSKKNQMLRKSLNSNIKRRTDR